MGSDPLAHRRGDEHLEIEVKLHVPSESFDQVEAAVRTGGPVHEVDLVAEYHDTDDWALAAHGLTWRVRREGRRWVQTLKGRTDTGPGDTGPGDAGRTDAGATVDDPSMTRVEHEVDVTDRAADEGTAPSPDPVLHDGPSGRRLAEVLASVEGGIGALRQQFTTDVHRIERRADNEHGAVLVALDRGLISAGGLSIVVSELEIELVEGAAAAVLAEADEWARRFGLEREPLNKARRGRALAITQRALQPERPSPAGGVGASPDDR